MKKILEDGEGAAMPPTNNTTNSAAMNPNDPRNPPVFKNKRKPQLLKNILKRKGPK
jgi:hypothetical protein